MRCCKVIRLLMTLFIFCIYYIPVYAQPESISPAQDDLNPGFMSSYGNIPLYFIRNTGQVDGSVHYYARTPGYTLWATSDGIIFDMVTPGGSDRDLPGKRNQLSRPSGPSPAINQEQKFHRSVSEFSLVGMNRDCDIEAIDITGHRVNYFIGSDRAGWVTDIPTSTGIRYKNVYSNIDLKVYGHGTRVEYDFYPLSFKIIIYFRLFI